MFLSLRIMCLCLLSISFAQGVEGKMKTIGLLGGTGWSSTIGYYRLLNEKVNARLGGYHSANIILKSIDYHTIMSSYGKDHNKVAQALKTELMGLIALQPDCILICCNTLHKYYDLIKDTLDSKIPVFHVINLVSEKCLKKDHKKVLFLATRFSMEDGFFAQGLEEQGIHVTIPQAEERQKMERIHEDLMQNKITAEGKSFFKNLINQHKNLDAVILGCTEYPLIVNQEISVLPIIDPVELQTSRAVDFALEDFK